MTELTLEEISEQRVTDFLHSFSGPHGERVVKYLSDFCYEKDTTYIPDSDESVFREGARAVIIEIRRWLEYDLTKVGDEPKEYDRV